MKSSFTRGLAATLFIGFLALLLPARCYGDTAFTLNVPFRLGGNVPVGVVKMRFELDAAATGAQLVIDESPVGPGAEDTVVTLGGFGLRPNGDVIAMLAIAGSPQSVDIVYTPISVRQVATNPCNSRPAASFPLVVSLNLTGASITSYRMSSLTSPRIHDQTDPLEKGQCDQPIRRIQTSVASISLPAAMNRGRMPIDLVFVLDKSGSMAGLPPGTLPPGTTQTRWELLRESLETFIDFWTLAEATDPAGSTPQDRIAVILFSSNVVDAVLPFVARGADGSAWASVITSLPASPSGSTGMGAGLKRGIEVWKLSPTNDVVVVLMTDGEQNVPLPRIDPDGSGIRSINGLTTLAPPCTTNQIITCGIVIQGVAIGHPGSVPDTLLEEISKQNSGKSRLIAGPGDGGIAFRDALVEALKGNTLSVLGVTRDTLSGNASAPVTFFLDGSVRRANYVLEWDGGRRDRLGLEITGPGNTVITPVARKDRAKSTVQSIDIPGSGPIGNWSVRVVRVVGPPTPITYRLSAYSDEGRLDYRFSFPAVSEGTGDTMTMNAEVSYDGNHLTNLPADAIKLKIERPNEGLGSALHRLKVGSSVLTTETAGAGDTTTPYERKLANLAGLKQLGGTFPQAVKNDALLDNGNSANGDGAANDGVYSARFGDTSRPGLYRFVVTLDWDDSRTGRIHREETIERVVRVTPDATASTPSVSGRSKGGFEIRVTPQDRFGNFYGPSSDNPITVTVTGGGTVVGITDPQQTGDYIIQLEGVPAGADPHIVIKVDQTTIVDSPLSGLPGGGGFRRWGLSLHAGASIPHGNFNTIFNPGPNLGVDLEYRINPMFSLEGIYTFHRFNGDTFGPVTVGDINLHQVSANGKIYGSSAPVRPFFNFGGGVYKFDPGPTRGGINLGGGFQFDVAPHIAVDAMYNFHNVFTSGSSVKFSTVQGGVRFRF